MRGCACRGTAASRTCRVWRSRRRFWSRRPAEPFGRQEWHRWTRVACASNAITARVLRARVGVLPRTGRPETHRLAGGDRARNSLALQALRGRAVREEAIVYSEADWRIRIQHSRPAGQPCEHVCRAWTAKGLHERDVYFAPEDYGDEHGNPLEVDNYAISFVYALRRSQVAALVDARRATCPRRESRSQDAVEPARSSTRTPRHARRFPRGDVRGFGTDRAARFGGSHHHNRNGPYSAPASPRDTKTATFAPRSLVPLRLLFRRVGSTVAPRVAAVAPGHAVNTASHGAMSSFAAFAALLLFRFFLESVRIQHLVQALTSSCSEATPTASAAAGPSRP